MYIEKRQNLYNDIQCTYRKGRIYIMMYNVHTEKVEFNDVQCTYRKGRTHIMMYNVHRETVEFI